MHQISLCACAVRIALQARRPTGSANTSHTVLSNNAVQCRHAGGHVSHTLLTPSFGPRASAGIVCARCLPNAEDRRMGLTPLQPSNTNHQDRPSSAGCCLRRCNRAIAMQELVNAIVESQGTASGSVVYIIAVCCVYLVLDAVRSRVTRHDHALHEVGRLSAWARTHIHTLAQSMHAHARTHTNTHKHTRTHTHIHTPVHTHIHTNTQTHTNARSHTHTCACTCTHIHTCTHPHIHTHMHKNARTEARAHTHTHSSLQGHL